VSTDGWARATWEAVEEMVRALEAGTRFTVFEQPGKVARLPDALGGDPTRWFLLAAPAKSKEGFFDLLHAKAHFLMLPKPIVRVLKETWRAELDEDVVAAKGATGEHDIPTRGAFMHIPGGSDGLAAVGYDLARVTVTAPVPYDILDTIYHEMTHAWLWLAEFDDAELQKLAADGPVAYASSRGVAGTAFTPWTAFTEAAGAYVGDRVRRWCTALRDLDLLMRSPPADLDERRAKVQLISDRYDTFGTYVYGAVPTTRTTEEKIASPELSKPLRDAIDKKFLDGRPLTKDFAETPLAGLRDALLAQP
jgi:hypothetical protein